MALKRLFLILFPLSLFIAALFLSAYREDFQQKHTAQGSSFSLFYKKCPFYAGLDLSENLADSRLSAPTTGSADLSKNSWGRPNAIQQENQNKAPQDLAKIKGFQTKELVSLPDFNLSLKRFQQALKRAKISESGALIALPIALTKDNFWILSQNSFFITAKGQRHELSHLTYEEIKKLFQKRPNLSNSPAENARPVLLEDIFKAKWQGSFLFLLKHFKRDKPIEWGQILKAKTQGQIYISSKDERLLRDISSAYPKANVLHSFKTATRRSLLSAFGLGTFKQLKGAGLIVPDFLFPSEEILKALQKQNKMLFLTAGFLRQIPNQKHIQSAQAVISPHWEQLLKISQIKAPCPVAESF